MCTCLITEFTMHEVILVGKFTEKLCLYVLYTLSSGDIFIFSSILVL
jgi:hypothetical protein